MASAHDQIGLIMQLRRRGIRDNDVLRAIERVPRDLFVDPAFADHAYHDIALPIDCGQTISQPYVVAFMTERLELDARHKVLEIGTGSGYQAAVLAHLCRRVYTVERWRELQKAAERRFARLGITNVTTREANAFERFTNPRAHQTRRSVPAPQRGKAAIGSAGVPAWNSLPS